MASEGKPKRKHNHEMDLSEPDATSLCLCRAQKYILGVRTPCVMCPVGHRSKDKIILTIFFKRQCSAKEKQSKRAKTWKVLIAARVAAGRAPSVGPEVSSAPTGDASSNVSHRSQLPVCHAFQSGAMSEDRRDGSFTPKFH